MNIQTTYKSTRDFETTTRRTNILLYRITTDTGGTIEFLRSYNQLMVYKDSHGKITALIKTPQHPAGVSQRRFMLINTYRA